MNIGLSLVIYDTIIIRMYTSRKYTYIIDLVEYMWCGIFM